MSQKDKKIEYILNLIMLKVMDEKGLELKDILDEKIFDEVIGEVRKRVDELQWSIQKK